MWKSEQDERSRDITSRSRRKTRNMQSSARILLSFLCLPDYVSLFVRGWNLRMVLSLNLKLHLTNMDSVGHMEDNVIHKTSNGLFNIQNRKRKYQLTSIRIM